MIKFSSIPKTKLFFFNNESIPDTSICKLYIDFKIININRSAVGSMPGYIWSLNICNACQYCILISINLTKKNTYRERVPTIHETKRNRNRFRFYFSYVWFRWFRFCLVSLRFVSWTLGTHPEYIHFM